MLAARKVMMGGSQLPELMLVNSGVFAGSGNSMSFTPVTDRIGQLQVMMLSNGREGGLMTPPAGWNEALDNTSGVSAHVYWREIVADDAGAQTFTFGGSSSVRSYIRMFWANAAFDTIGAFATASGTTPATAPAITAAGGILFALGVTSEENGAFSQPAGMTVTQRQEPAATQCGMALFQQDIGAGSTGTRSLANSVSGVKGGALFSIKGK
ncbi:hypothetical protein [Caenibius sp. WL]|uniref:hypothetical protein n=1 Tax=Caenibius sp. WL TaxID=2872646 RepID=UPI001C9A1CAC|nr:hypothetical protein [Caenibius sp. WL]QZP06789.1 hypothetical protein K5X80_08615 [Caenibius sp. WL]